MCTGGECTVRFTYIVRHLSIYIKESPDWGGGEANQRTAQTTEHGILKNG